MLTRECVAKDDQKGVGGWEENAAFTYLADAYTPIRPYLRAHTFYRPLHARTHPASDRVTDSQPGHMETIRTVETMQRRADDARRARQRLALVPTMGALHEGHLALVREAQRRADHVTVSIFVNPTQFAPSEDLARYPRDLEGDRETLAALGADVVFAPSETEMYPQGEEENRTWVSVDELAMHLCGRHRPGHFRGVMTVVAKLFHVCKPHVAIFGQKDAQQLVMLRRMARDLLFGVEVASVPIQREPDGLARSSRNAYLSAAHRQQAGVLSQAVEAAKAQVEAGEQPARTVVETMKRIIGTALDARLQYAEVVELTTLSPVEMIAPGQEVLVAVAVFFGDTRLIDNAVARAPVAEAATARRHD